MVGGVEFREIDGLYGYRFGSDGTVWSVKSGSWKTLATVRDHKGYLRVNLFVLGRKLVTTIHRLVARAFLTNPLNKREVNHKNGVKDDNRPENLEWVTASENALHAYANGLWPSRAREKNGRAKLTSKDVAFIRSVAGRTTALARQFGVCRSTIQQIRRGHLWSESNA